MIWLLGLQVGFISFLMATIFMYGKCSMIANTFLCLFSNKTLVFGAGIHKMFQLLLGRQLVFEILEHLP